MCQVRGDVGLKNVLTCSSWGGRSNKALFVSQLVLTLAACACASVVTICHLTSLLIMPLLLLFDPIIFLSCPLLVGGSCCRFSGPDLDQRVGRVGLELTGDEENC